MVPPTAADGLPPEAPADVVPGGAETVGGAPSLTVDAPITAVVVFPSSARVTRRGRVEVPSLRRVEVVVGGLPLDLDEDSVRVGGTGPARVLGVNVVSQSRAVPDAGVTADLHSRRDSLRARLAELADEDETEQARRSFLDVAARVGAGALARGWAGETGADDPGARLVAVGDALAAQVSAGHARRRALAAEREQVEKDIAAVDRMIAARRGRSEPDTRAVAIDLELPAAAESVPAESGPAESVPAESGPAGSAPGESAPGGAPTTGSTSAVEVEVSYLVRSARWTSGYDARLEGERVTLTWFAMISQRTGEDWPAADLRLSTARPSGSRDLPELRPQYVDVRRPPAPRSRGGRGRTGPPGEALGAAAADYGAVPASPAMMPAGAPRAAVAMAAAEATVESTGAASTYRPARAVPVPADGDPHRTTVAVVELAAVLDHLTVPKIAAAAYLRATVTNTSAHTLLPGKVSIFHDQEFVGTAWLDLVPPGGEMELQLGVDDRVRVERELVRRSTGKRMVGNVRRTEVGYRVTIENHAPVRTRVTVHDQVPVSRHESILIKDVTADPATAEQTDLGVLTWNLELEPGTSREIGLSYRLEHPRGIELTGWGD